MVSWPAHAHVTTTDGCGMPQHAYDLPKWELDQTRLRFRALLIWSFGPESHWIVTGGISKSKYKSFIPLHLGEQVLLVYFTANS